MTRASLFHYISPKILPLFPKETGTVGCVIDPQYALNIRSGAKFTGTAEITFSTYAAGEKLSEETVEFEVKDNEIVNGGPIWRTFECDDYGYAEITFGCSEPVFNNVIPEPGYAMLITPDRGNFTINPDMKYANPRVIQQIKQYHRFCMLHSAVFCDSESGSGNSMMLINPYDQPLVTKMYSSRTRYISKKVPPKYAYMIDMAELFEDGQVGTVMLTANNRVITYDVCHGYGNQHLINSVDHHDPFSGVSTLSKVPFGTFARTKVRNALRTLSIRPD
jgi:hypothetical protein